ncbi:MAG: autotransporter-associated beta strand repeat-containing protein, partial [Kiritimatiellia bacterium]
MNVKFLAGSIVLAFTALLGAEAATCVWKGAGDATKWTDAANWEGGVPTGGDTARFSEKADISEDFAIGAGTLTIEVTGKDVYLRGVISGAGGVKKTGGGKLHLVNEANTYTGSTEISGGELWFKSLADIGQPSSLGAPSTEAALVRLSGTLYMENQSDANRVLTTDRPFEFRACTFRTSYQPVTVNLNGAITGTGVTWRGNGTINVASFIPATFTGNFGRTDNGVVNLLCPTNAFHTTGTTFVNLSDGAFRGTLADAGVPSGFGAGARFQLGQQNFDTTGRVYYNGPTSTNCNREIRIEVYTNGSYTVKRGGRLNNETPGTTIAFTGKLILNGNSKYAAHSAPMLWVGGEGNGVLTAPLIDNLSLEKDSAGTWTLTGASTTTGCVNVAQGRLDFDGSLVDGTGYDGPKVSVGRDAVLGGTGTVHCTVQMAMGAKLAPGHADAFGTLRFGPADIWFNPTSSFDVKIGAGTNDCIVSTGDVRANGDVTVNVVPMGVEEIPPGVYTLIQANTFTMPRFTLGPGAPLGSSLAVDAKSLRLIVPEASHRTLVWTGRAGEAWDTTTANWLDGEAEATFAAGDAVRFDDSSTVTNVTIAGAVEPFAVTVSATNANYTIGGEGIDGEEAQLVKSGPATLKFTGRQAFPLGAQVNEGKLVLDGT